MNSSDVLPFQGVMQALAAQYGIPWTEALNEGFWMGLEDLPLPAIKHAIARAIRECTHMPRVIELRQMCGEMPSEQRSVLAWAALCKAISSYGSYRSVDFDDPLINATVRNLGGWQKLCSTTTEEFEKWTRKDFERVYSSLAHSGTSAESCKYLMGAHEQTNSAEGFAADGPTRVLTGLPPHSHSIVRELTHQEQLVLVASNAQPESKPAVTHERRMVVRRECYVVRMRSPRAEARRGQLNFLFA